MVTWMEDCNFPLVLWGTRKSLDIVTSVCLRHFGSFSMEGEPFGLTS